MYKRQIFTQEVTDNAVVLVYARTASINAIVPIPIILDQNTNYFFGVIPEINALRIIAATLDGSTIFFDDFTAFRYVIIPPSSSGRSSSIESITKDLQAKGIDINNYDEVAAYYNLD